jgi:hypothetical protein
MLPQQLERRATWGEVAEWGAISGVIAGIAMAMLLLIVNLARGVGVWRPLYLFAATFNPSWARASGFELAPLLVGMLLHLIVSTLFGAIFAVLVRFVLPTAVSLTVAAILGLLWGLALLVVMTFAITPGADPALVRAVMHDGGAFIWWVVAHLLYGGVLGAAFAQTIAASLPSPTTRFGPQVAS